MEMISLKSLAKINLGLDVLGRRENGYHDVCMIMQSVYLFDEITIEKTTDPGVSLTSNLYYLPSDSRNIAWKAAQMLLEEFSITGGVAIALRKRIPVAAGLAGGSSNAAAVLVGMNRLFNLHLSEQELMDRGASLGADVPYCVMRGTVLAEGIGEQLKRLTPMPSCTILLAKPPISVSTKTVYEKLDSVPDPPHPDMRTLQEMLDRRDLRGIAGSMGNILESVTIEDYPVISRIKRMMLDGGALGAIMSGSGPTVFGVYGDRKLAKKTAGTIRDEGIAKEVFVTNVHRNRYERG